MASWRDRRIIDVTFRDASVQESAGRPTCPPLKWSTLTFPSFPLPPRSLALLRLSRSILKATQLTHNASLSSTVIVFFCSLESEISQQLVIFWARIDYLFLIIHTTALSLLLLRICNVHKSGKFALWWKHSWIVICQLDFMDTSFVWRKKKRGKVNNSRQCHLRWWGFNDGEPSSHLSTSPQRDKGPPTVSGTVRGINSTFCACVRVCLEACALWKWQIVRRWSR